MDATETIYFIFSSVLSWLPQLLVLIGSMVFCLSQMSKNPRAGKMALTGLAVMLLTAILGIGLSWVQANLTFWMRDNLQKVGYIILAFNLVQGAIWSIGLGILVYAVFVGRDEKA